MPLKPMKSDNTAHDVQNSTGNLLSTSEPSTIGRRRFLLGLMLLSGAPHAAIASPTANNCLDSAQGDSTPRIDEETRSQLIDVGDTLRNLDLPSAQRLEAIGRQALQIDKETRISLAMAESARNCLTDRARVNREFSLGQAVLVQGWFLSDSEAAVAILYSLANSASS